MELRKTWKYHLLLGIIILGMDYFRDYVYKGTSYFLENFEPAYILLKVTFLITFYSIYILNYTLVCPNTLSKKRIAQFFIAVILMPFLFAGIRYILEEVLVFHIFGFHNYSDKTRVFWYYIFDNSYYTIKSLLFSTSMYLLFMYIRNINSIHRLEIEHQNAELQLLKGQLEPHFLFNTLNAFYTELVDTQPKTAKSIYKLSELLRYITYEAKNDFMSLRKELNFIEDYIYFYRKRFENNLFLTYEVNGKIGEERIPSMVLIHFIENTFKHGILNHKDHPASISIEVNETYICIHTKNRISKGHSYSQKGIGRENLVKRLDMLFPNDYTLKYGIKETYFEAFLQLPLTK